MTESAGDGTADCLFFSFESLIGIMTSGFFVWGLQQEQGVAGKRKCVPTESQQCTIVIVAFQFNKVLISQCANQQHTFSLSPIPLVSFNVIL